uniref:PHD-type domain-containing protein n=1 Tax=Cyprinus carpio TaxID=7962 RepID=A0A8C1VIB8_CYPCA
MPSTPGLQYGRVCVRGARRDVLVCCLCGRSANAVDLGDLHGPYYSEGFKSASKVVPNPQEEDNSDSDSSFGEKCVASGSWTNSSSGLSNSPSSKRPKTDGDTDWFSPPVVPLDANEHWLHEDCAIRSAGVFLVRGKLYGLETVVRLVCSTCQRRGATLGCVFKGCPDKYHYMCALQSGCVLNEDHFSMKCRKQKVNVKCFYMTANTKIFNYLIYAFICIRTFLT